MQKIMAIGLLALCISQLAAAEIPPGVWGRHHCEELGNAGTPAWAWVDGIATGVNVHLADRLALAEPALERYHQKVLDWCEDGAYTPALSWLAVEAFVELRDAGPSPKRMTDLKEALKGIEQNAQGDAPSMPYYEKEENRAGVFTCKDLGTEQATQWLLGWVTGVNVSTPLKNDIFYVQLNNPETLMGKIQKECGGHSNSLFDAILAVYKEIANDYLEQNDRATAELGRQLAKRTTNLSETLDSLVEAQQAEPRDFASLTAEVLTAELRSNNGAVRTAAHQELLRRAHELKKIRDDEDEYLPSETGLKLSFLWQAVSNSGPLGKFPNYSDRLRRRMVRTLFPKPDLPIHSLLNGMKNTKDVKTALALFKTYKEILVDARDKIKEFGHVTTPFDLKLGKAEPVFNLALNADPLTQEKVLSAEVLLEDFTYRMSVGAFAFQVDIRPFSIYLAEGLTHSEKVIWRQTNFPLTVTVHVRSVWCDLVSNQCSLPYAPDEFPKKNFFDSFTWNISTQIPEGARKEWTSHFHKVFPRPDRFDVN